MKNKTSENLLDAIPLRKPKLDWSADDNGIITLNIENKGFWNRVFQKLLNKPKITYIHLDKTGSFLWPLLDGEKTVNDLGVLVKEKFGDEAEPLYERLTEYIKILRSNGFISFKS